MLDNNVEEIIKFHWEHNKMFIHINLSFTHSILTLNPFLCLVFWQMLVFVNSPIGPE